MLRMPLAGTSGSSCKLSSLQDTLHSFLLLGPSLVAMDMRSLQGSPNALPSLQLASKYLN